MKNLIKKSLVLAFAMFALTSISFAQKRTPAMSKQAPKEKIVKNPESLKQKSQRCSRAASKSRANTTKNGGSKSDGNKASSKTFNTCMKEPAKERKNK